MTMATRTLLNSGLSAGPHRPRTYRKPQPAGETLVVTGSGAGDGQPPADPNPQPPATGDAGETVVVPDDITKVDDLKDWVGDDPVRAQAVIDRENAGSYQRKTLLAHMADIVVS
jgi:hypothetical protein